MLFVAIETTMSNLTPTGRRVHFNAETRLGATEQVDVWVRDTGKSAEITDTGYGVLCDFTEATEDEPPIARKGWWINPTPEHPGEMVARGADSAWKIIIFFSSPETIEGTALEPSGVGHRWIYDRLSSQFKNDGLSKLPGFVKNSVRMLVRSVRAIRVT